MRKIFFLLFLFITTVCNSQLSINGTVVDSITKLPVPYTSVILTSGKSGAITDDLGHFSLSFPNSEINSQLVISCIGYVTAILKMDSLINSKKIEIHLSPQALTLAETSILSYKISELCNERWGIRKSPAQGDYLMNFGNEIALLIRNDSSETGVISSLKFYIMENGNPNTPFRAKLYRINPKDTTPGDLMLDTNLIVSAKRGSSWAEISIKDLGINIPVEGFFVSMEWLPICECYIDSIPSPNGMHQFSGQVLGANSQLKGNYTWSKGLNKDWSQFVYRNTQSDYFNAMIGAEVLIKCK